jgi:hypothetical protein
MLKKQQLENESGDDRVDWGQPAFTAIGCIKAT